MKKKSWIIISLGLAILGSVANINRSSSIEIAGASSYEEEIPKQLLQEQIDQYYRDNEVMLITAYVGIDKMEELDATTGDILEINGSVYRVEYSPLVEKDQIALKVITDDGPAFKVIEQ